MTLFRPSIHATAIFAILALCLSNRLFASGYTNVNTFGFTGPEIFPIDNQISQLHVADIDGDGLNDLIVVNNSRSKINILYNQTGKTNATELSRPAARRNRTNLPPDARFRIESIASEKRISSLVVADLNGDGRPDIAYYGEPKELVVLYNQGSNAWSAPKRWPIEDGQLTANALEHRRFERRSPHRPRVARAKTSFISSPKSRTILLANPRKFPSPAPSNPCKFSTSTAMAAAICCSSIGKTQPLSVSACKRTTANSGPKLTFAFPPIRSYWADNLEANNKTQIITIAQNSGRAQISEFNRKPAEPSPALSSKANSRSCL